MPTGYVQAFADGKQSFAEFLWTCTRALGYMGHMYHEELDTPFRVRGTQSSPDTYHVEQLAQCQRKLEAFTALPANDQEAFIVSELEASLAIYYRELDRCKRINARIQQAKAELSKLHFPPKHQEFVQFVSRQLDSSLENEGFYEEEIAKKQHLVQNLMQAIQEYLSNLERDIKYHQEHIKSIAAQLKATDPADEWFAALDRIVPLPENLATPEFVAWIRKK